MDFFEHQDTARRRSGRLVLCFSLAVVATVLAIYLVVYPVALFVGGMIAGQFHLRSNPLLNLFAALGVLFLVGGVTTCVIVLGSLYKARQLAAGGQAVARMLGGRQIDPNTRDLAERRLLNVVEETALAAGTPVPPVYVLDKEPSINAFVAGHEPADAVIALTRGCLVYLTRDELQGLVAHEFSHVLNGDMRLNLRLISTVHGLRAVVYLGAVAAFGDIRDKKEKRKKRESKARSRRRDDALPTAVIGIPVLFVGFFGAVLASWIRSVFSRQREYLADASAVQFTRLPDGITGALKKIGGLGKSSRIKDSHAEEICHMFFGSASRRHEGGTLGTHPPLAERIRRIDPTFDGKFPKPVEIAPEPVEATAKREPGKPFEAMAPGVPIPPIGTRGSMNKRKGSP